MGFKHLLRNRYRIILTWLENYKYMEAFDATLLFYRNIA